MGIDCEGNGWMDRFMHAWRNRLMEVCMHK